MQTKSNYMKIIDLVNQINQNEVLRLANYLNDLTLSEWLSSFREKMKAESISEDEIVDLVKETRRERYASSY